MAQKGSNFDTLSFCFAGNLVKNPQGVFVDIMTASQHLAFEDDLKALLDGNLSKFIVAPNTQISIDPYQIKPHYFYSQTECYGTLLTPIWGRDIALNHLNLKLSYFKALLEYLKLKLQQQKLGSTDLTPCFLRNERG